MPRGEHLKKVEDDEIAAAFDAASDRLGRPLISSSEIAMDLPVSGEAVRQRLHKMDSFEKVELGGGTSWKRAGAEVWRGYAGVLALGPFISKPAIGKASGGAVAGTGALTAFASFVGWYSFIWLLPLLAWAVWAAWEFDISPDDLRPSRWSDLSRSFVGMQILGAWVVLGTSILARSLLGIGPGISGAPNLVVGFDVTGALFLLTTGALVWSAVVAIPTKQVSEVPA